MPAILVRELVKTFGSTRALDGLDLTVQTGEIHGFLGPNGSGKSTTLRILLGLARADSGTAELLGADPRKHAVDLHRRLAYVPGDVALWPNLSGGEIIDLLGRLRGGLYQQRRSSLLERFQLDPTKKGRSYSKGNRQKVALVAALSSDVELLLLDEPTSGLDPLMEASFRDCLMEETAQGRTVLLSSHILAEVEAVCGRVTIIRSGRTVQTGALAELRQLSRTFLSLQLAGPAPEGLGKIPGVHALQIESLPRALAGADHGATQLNLQVEQSALDEVLRQVTKVGVISLNSQPPTLEELFLRFYADPAIGRLTETATHAQTHAQTNAEP